VRLAWQFDADRVARPHFAAYEDDGHDSGLADEVAAFVPPQRRLSWAGLKVVQLVTGIAQAGYLDDCAFAESQFRTDRQLEQINTARRDVLTHQASGHGKSGPEQFLVQFRIRRRKTINLGRAGRARAQPSALIAVFSFILVPLGSPQLSPSIEANMRSKEDFYQ
jgi:hypothetical protein